MVLDELIEQALNKVKSRKIKDVRAGLGYTCVMLEDGACGLAYTFRNNMGNLCCIYEEAGNLIGMDAARVIRWLTDNNRLKAAIALAAINAVLNDPAVNWDKGNVVEAISVSENDKFGMVGEFKPILPKIRTMTKNIYVFEQNLAKGGDLYSESDIPVYLPQCDVIVLTATSIINHTIDDVVLSCKNARQVCLVGPSTPLCPEVMGKYNITLLAASVVKNPELILQIVSQGGGTKTMKPAINQVLVQI